MGPLIDTERWCATSMPYSWLPAARPAQRAPHAVSTCELEADCVAPDILNRTYAIRQPLSSAGARARSSSASPPLSRNCVFEREFSAAVSLPGCVFCSYGIARGAVLSR